MVKVSVIFTRDFWSKSSMLILVHLYMFIFWVLVISGILKESWVFGYLRTSLLCIVGELAGGGSVAVAVGVSDR